MFLFVESSPKARLGYYGPNFGLHELNLSLNDSTIDCITKDVIIHELLHILGFIHEFTRPDRDEYLTVVWPKILVIFLLQGFLNKS